MEVQFGSELQLSLPGFHLSRLQQRLLCYGAAVQQVLVLFSAVRWRDAVSEGVTNNTEVN